jgi:L-lactate dehydrogenase complex protein LldE
MSNETAETARPENPSVGLFVTCLIDLMRPSVGFAAVKLLEDAGCRVDVPRAQTCCGQPAFNSGDMANSQAIAKQVIEAFSQYDYVVGASGSCMGTIRTHYPEIFKDDPEWLPRAEELAGRSYELVSFLTRVMDLTGVEAAYQGQVTYHDSCSGLRELGIKQEPRQLLASVDGLSLTEMEDTEVCCGFGGTFCVKYPEISVKMVDDKVKTIEATGADTLLSGDLGCLLNICGRLTRLNKPMRVYHVAEVLAGMTDKPGLGQGEEGT